MKTLEKKFRISESLQTLTEMANQEPGRLGELKHLQSLRNVQLQNAQLDDAKPKV